MSTESETTSPPAVIVRNNLPALRCEAIVPSSDRARLAAILATCSLAGLAGGLALSMVAGAQQASASMRANQRAAMAREAEPLTWLGLQIVDACKDQRCDGARVKRVIPGSPAHRAGFRNGDVVLRFDDDHVGSADELILAVRASTIGAPVDITVRRGAAETVLEPQLGAMPAHIRAQVEPRY